MSQKKVKPSRKAKKAHPKAKTLPRKGKTPPKKPKASPRKARYLMIGGFLGAGKTTAVARLARHLTTLGRRVGLISNDQSSGLVDTAILRSKGFSVEEIPGGCFCCRFPSLIEAAKKLTRDARPDIFVAEPVGSCTDLVATVSYPLRRIYGDQYEIGPLSVLVDPERALRILGLEKGRSFSEKVIYVYRKQLEEADAIVVNKTDTLTPAARDRLVDHLRKEYPEARVFSVSAQDGTGIDEWFRYILESAPRGTTALDLDYDRYAEGEAELGWLNATARVTAKTPVNANDTLLTLARTFRDRLAQKGHEIAHLKMTLDPEDGTGSLSVVSLVRSEGEPDLRESILDGITGGSLVINLRAEAPPELLELVTRDALAQAKALNPIFEHLERFRPARPVPVHRMPGGKPQ
jgi:G3E family GTPase